MSEEAGGSHTLIARPPGLSGYLPQRYCSVCGLTSVNKEVSSCSIAHCPNVAHSSCIGASNIEFNCSQVGALRTARGITAPVLHVTESAPSVPQAGALPPPSPSDTEDEELLELPPSELIKIIRQLRLEVTKKNNTIRFYNQISPNIGATREALVTVLGFIDNIAATTSTLEGLGVRSIASTARPDKIDDDWVKHVTASQETQTWWTSPKPQALLNNTSVLPPGSCQQSTDTPFHGQPAADHGATRHRASSPCDSANGLSVHRATSPSPLPPAPRDKSRGSNHQSPTSSPQQESDLDNPRVSQSRHVTSRHNQAEQPSRGPITNKHNKHKNSFKNSTITRGQDKHTQNTSTQAPRQHLGTADHPRPSEFCFTCRRKNHTEASCPMKKWCDYCHRPRHTTQECRTRLAAERQEQFLHKITSEQALNNANLVQTLTRLLAPASFSPPFQATNLGNNWTSQQGPQANTQQPLLPHPGPPLNLPPGVWSHGQQ